MGNFLALMRRELGAYFSSAMAYVILTSLLIGTGYMFTELLDYYQQNRYPARFGQYLWSLISILVLVSPLITMRLIAEEKSSGTIETLMTTPVSEIQIVLAKYFSAILFLHFLLLVPILGFAVIVGFYTVIDPGALFTSYLGILLVCGAIFSIGTFVSSLCRNQISAGVITFIVTILLVLANFGASNAPEESLLRAVLQRVDLLGGVQDFLKGIVDSRHVVYYLTVCLLFLFLTVRVVHSRRWR